MKDLSNLQRQGEPGRRGRRQHAGARIFEELIASITRASSISNTRFKADDPMPGVIESIAYMRGVLAGMGYATA